jgi:hypothetical protein
MSLRNFNIYKSSGVHVLRDGNLGKVGPSRRKVVAIVEGCLGRWDSNVGHG